LTTLRHIGIVVVLYVHLLFSCHPNQDGSIDGAVIPQGSSARITAIQDGRFRVILAAGTYTIRVVVADSPFPLQFNDITVKSGETTSLPPLELMIPTDTGGLSGKIKSRHSSAEVKLIYDGKAKDSVHTDFDGKYEFKDVLGGSYVMQAFAPEHATFVISVVITDNHNLEQNVVRLPAVAIDGANWVSGKIHAMGYGMPPPNASPVAVRREMAKRVAVTHAQRNMLKIIEQIRIDSD
jgi:hypothetical protein